MSIFDSEGTILSNILGRYSKGTPNCEIFLKGMDGDSLMIHRKGSRSIELDSIYLTLCLSIQPRVFCDFRSERIISENGLLDRFICINPSSKLGLRTFFTPQIERASLDDYSQNIEYLLAKMLNTFEPFELQLSEEAQKAFGDYYLRIEELIRVGAFRVSWLSKSHGYLARLASLLHVFEYPEEFQDLKLSQETIHNAYKVWNVIYEHTKYSHSPLEEVVELARAKAILGWIIEKQVLRVSQRELHQELRKSSKETKDLTVAAIKLLEDKGFLKLLPNQRRNSFKYQVNPVVFDYV